MSDGQIVFEVTADGKHAIANVKEITKAIQQESGKWDDAAKKSADNINNTFSGMLKKLVAGFSAVKIGKALLDIGQDALQAASDLEEVQNVVDVTFGDNASKIEAWAKAAGTQFGLTETQAKRFTSTLGAMMKSAGLSGDKIADVSTDLAGLAADMASFYNLDFDTAFQKIRSGLSGETEPLKQLGINMSVANLNAYALQQGLSKTFEQMNQGEQTMLRYQYMMQATADAQGDFSRTSDGYANSLRMLETNVESLRTKLGELLLPAVNDAVKWLNDTIASITSDGKTRTVLDDFNDIEIQTAEKLRQIKETAEEARLLVDELEGINNAKTDEAIQKVQKFANDLEGIKLDQSKAGRIKDFLGVLSENIETVAQIKGESAEGTKKWLEEIGAAADKLDPNDAAGWEKLLTTLKNDLPGLADTEFGTKFFDSFENLNISDKAESVKKFIDDLSQNMGLVQELSGKDATETAAWLESIGKAAGELDPNDAAGWEKLLTTIKKDLPGIENTSLGAEFFNSFNNLKIGDKAEQVKSFIATLAENMGTVQELSGKDAEGAVEWLKQIGEAADSLSPEDAEGWEKLINTIKEGLPGIENTDFGAAFFASLGEGFSDVEKQSSVLDWAIDALGDKTNRTAEEQAYWLEVCKQLVKTIPGLSSIINTETGEVKGGTQAIKDYIKAWEEGQTKLALLGALEQKESALSSRFSDLPGLQLDMALEKRRARQRLEELKDVYQKYGAQIGFGKDGKVLRNFSSIYGLTEEARKELNAAADALDEQYEKAQAAADAYKAQAEALEEAKQALEEYRQTINEMPGSTEDLADASEKFWRDNEDNIKAVTSAAAEAIRNLDDYVQGVHDSVRNAVNSIIKGFSHIGKAGDELRNQSNEIANSEQEVISKYSDVVAKWGSGEESLKRMQANYDNLTDREKEAYNELAKIHNKQVEINKSLNEYTPERMKANLQSQVSFMREYIDNLNKAREMGLSDELLASLADGSSESAEYLAQLVSGGKEAAEEVDKAFQEVQAAKKEFTDTLANQQLKVDATYQSLAEKAKEAVDALNLATEAGDNTGKTVEAVAKSISDHIPDVKVAVDGILEQLARLSGYGVTIDFGSFGEINFVTATESSTPALYGEDYVPRDNMLYRLHEGERVLTAQENQIWNALRNGGIAGFDLEALGGVMRDNIGGNVYLDGKTVGRVISDQQGKSFRQLQRSGWQG